jgi:hypothetical protein
MSMEVPPTWADSEPKGKLAKNVVFWATPKLIERLDAVCDSMQIDRSEVLRALVSLFLNDYPIQNRIMEEVKRNHV